MAERPADALRAALARVAPGTGLREAIDYIISGGSGALITVGDVPGVEVVSNGGFRVDIEFTPQRLFELAKMDGAILVDDAVETVLMANVHLVPNQRLTTSETGMRHRTAERVSRETKALVVSISQRRDTVSLYLGGHKLVLQHVEVLLAKANQALGTLERYRTRLDETLTRLDTLEFDDRVTLDDVSEVIRRFEMVLRVSRAAARYIAELGDEGQLVRMQTEELTVGVDDEYTLLLRDYAADPALRAVAGLRAHMGSMRSEQLLDADEVALLLGLPAAPGVGEGPVRPRGYRLLRRIPMLPTTVVTRLVDRFGSLQGLLAASPQQLDDVDGVGGRRARAILDGLERLRRGRAL